MISALRGISVIVAVASGAVASGAFAQSNGSWQTLAPMPTARQELATAVLGGKVYTIGGYDAEGRSTALVEVYDPSTDNWSSAAPIPSATNHSAAAVAAGKLYSINGGITHVYDPAANSWSQVASTRTGHAGTPAVGVFEDKIYIAGGAAAASTRELEVYDPAINTWTTRAPMNVARNHTGGAFIDGKFYVVGGRGSTDAPTALEVYDPRSDTWQMRAPMPTGRSGIAVAAVNGELFVFGGEIPDLHPEVEAYNPATNTWRRLSPMPHPRHGISASVIGARVYLPGGGNQQGFGATNINEVFVLENTAGALGNISTRGFVQTGDNVMIGGFIVAGESTKRVIIRGVGPSLAQFGVPAPLADPTLQVFNAAGQSIASNDNWQDAPNRQEIIASGRAPQDAREAAILINVPPGGSTAVLRGATNTTGVGLVEVYDLDFSSSAKLANVSTRGFVQTGDNIMIGGIIIEENMLRVIARAIGPSLAQYGVPGVLANPTLELRDVNGSLVAANDDWRSSQETEIIASGRAPADNRESAIIRTLQPGNYTGLVRGVGGTTGVALVEAYALP